MKTVMRISVAFLIAFLLVFSPASIYFDVSATEAPDYSSEINTGKRGDICVTLEGTGAGEYYAREYAYGNLEKLTSENLFEKLADLMTDTHVKKSTYDDCRDMAHLTDCEDGNGRVTLFYSSKSVSQDDFGSSGWAREHVWQKSKGGDTVTGGGADLHHVRPSDSKLGNSVGDLKYGEVDEGKEMMGGALSGTDLVGGYYNEQFFEPLDNVKGDIARICLYMYVRWGEDWKCSSLTKVFESVDVLLEWCMIDPVDTWEMGRNEVVCAYQGNRNVFIDYPELAWLIFDRDIPKELTSPLRGLYIPECDHTETELRNKLDPTCGDFGYTGDTYCKACNEKLSDGSPVDPTGEHDFYHACDTSCNVCGYERSITHSYRSKWSSDENGHWHACSVCGIYDRIAEHEFENSRDPSCNICSYERTITTTSTQSATPNTTPPSGTGTTSPDATSSGGTDKSDETAPDVTGGTGKVGDKDGKQVIVTGVLFALGGVIIAVFVTVILKKNK